LPVGRNHRGIAVGELSEVVAPFRRGGRQILDPHTWHIQCQDRFPITEHKAVRLSPTFDAQEMFVIDG
jgi:hypothetical protein